MKGKTYDFALRFEMGLICFGDDDADSYIASKVPIAARVDQGGIAIHPPREAGYARLQISLLDEIPDVDMADWDFGADLLVHTLGGLWPSSIDSGNICIYDTISRQPCAAKIPVQMGIYRVRVLIANYHSTVVRLSEIDYNGEKASDPEYQYLNCGLRDDDRAGLPHLDFLMSCDHYQLYVAPTREVTVLKPL